MTPLTKQINFSVDVETKQKLQELADKEDLKIAQIIRRVVKKELKENEKQN